MLTLLHQDLEKIEHTAWISHKRGQQGIFYPESMIRFQKSFYMIFVKLPKHDGFFRSAFWFVWWNLQEIYDGFDKSRAMWVFQHKYSSFVWKLLKPSGGSQLRWRIGSQAGTVVTIQADWPIQIPWCEDHQEVNTKIPRSQWEKYSQGNTTCSPENVCSPSLTLRRKWISCQELARSTRHSAQERGKKLRFEKSNWIHIRGKLLVRSRICCCKPCLGRNWQNCELKVCLCTVALYIRKYD